MHVIEPRQREDGTWEMAVRGISPRTEPVSICLEEQDGELLLCEGHPTVLSARNCKFAKKWAKRIMMQGDTVIESLTPVEV